MSNKLKVKFERIGCNVTAEVLEVPDNLNLMNLNPKELGRIPKNKKDSDQFVHFAACIACGSATDTPYLMQDFDWLGLGIKDSFWICRRKHTNRSCTITCESEERAKIFISRIFQAITEFNKQRVWEDIETVVAE